MSSAGTVPEWTLADRLAKARQTVGLTQQDMADYLGLSKSAVAKFETGAPVRSAYLRLWAVRCDVPYQWLCGNDGSDNRPGPGDHSYRYFDAPGDRILVGAVA